MNAEYKEHHVKGLDRLFLWINSGCNFKCKMCDLWKTKLHKEMSLDDMQKLLPQVKDFSVTQVILCGESLLHSRIWKICKNIRSFDLEIELLSNGYLLEQNAEKIVKYCKFVRVSLDGPLKIHNSIRGIPQAFQKLNAGINALRNYDPTFQIDGRCAVHRLNYRYLSETVNAAHEIGLDSISFSGTDLYNEEAFKRTGHINEQYLNELALTHDDIQYLENELMVLNENCTDEFENGFISDSPEQLDQFLVQYYRMLNKELDMIPVSCNWPWTSAIIEYDGEVRPCFPMESYGNLHTVGSLLDIINSERALIFRRNLDVQNCSTCQRCVCPTYIKNNDEN